eukprot:114464_1
MSISCSLLQYQIINETLETNAINETLPEIWLYQDRTTLFNDKFWIQWQFEVGLCFVAFIVIVMSFYSVYIRHPRFVQTQKQLKLREAHRDHYIIFESDILPYLNQYTRYNQNVNGIIMEFANVTLKDINSVIIKTRVNYYCCYHKYGCYHKGQCYVSCPIPSYLQLVMHILIGTLLIACYIPMYMVTAHFTDSYLSYLKTECYYLYDPNFGLYMFDGISMEDICMNDSLQTDQYNFFVYDTAHTFISSYPNKYNVTQYESFDCFINKKTLKVRYAFTEADCKCCIEFVRWGKCSCIWGWRDSCCDSNFCAYVCCALCGGGCSLVWCLMPNAWVHGETMNTFTIDHTKLTESKANWEDEDEIEMIEIEI